MHSAAQARRVEVQVLGPIEVVGAQERPARKAALELVAFLALHRSRTYTADELRGAVWDMARTGEDGREVTAETLRSYISYARKAFGPDRIPDAGDGTGYRVSDEVGQPTPSASPSWPPPPAPHPEEEVALLTAALALVRGPIFANVARNTYGWAERDGITYDLEAMGLYAIERGLG